MSEFWFNASYFDTQSGVPLEDEIATERIATGDVAVRHIGELVTADEFTFKRQDFPDNEVAARSAIIKAWGPDECHAYGRWVCKLVETEDGPVPFTQTHIKRLSALVLGPGEESIITKTGISGIAEFRRIIGAPRGKVNARYRSWDVNKYAAYAQGLATQLDRKPDLHDYDTAAERGDGPSGKVISNSVVRSVMQLNELIWYPDSETMTAEDMAYWGVRARRANDGMRLTATVVGILSRRKRGPSERVIRDRFPSWRSFVERVDDLYEWGQATEASERKAKLALYDTMIGTGELPSDAAELTEGELLVLGGKYQLIQACAPDLMPELKLEIARTDSDKFISLLRKLKRKLMPGKIEAEASILGVFEDIWPLEDGTQYLVIGEEELRQALSHRATLNRVQRVSKRSVQDGA